MPSPDVADYVGLELIDLDSQQLVEQALASAAAKWPDWTPREGNTEVLLLEELAAMAEEDVYALNRIPESVTEALLRLVGVPLDAGAPASASVTFTAGDANGYTVPAGTIVRIDTASVDDLDLATDTDLVILAGQTTGTVTATATTSGAAGNGTPAGTELEVLDALVGIEGAVLATATGSGRDAEDTAAYLSRAVARLSTFTTTLVRPADVESYVASSYPAVERVKVLDRYNPAPGGSVGLDLGYTTVAVATAGGGALTAGEKATLDADLTDRMQAGIIVNVVDATLTAVDIDVTVLALSGYSSAEVQANVAAVLTAYLDPDAWPWSGIVRRNEIIARADTATGVDVVLSVTVPTADVTLPGVAALATPGTITVTVQAPA